MKLISLPLLVLYIVIGLPGAKSGKFPKSAKSPPPPNHRLTVLLISFLQFGSRKVPLGAKKDRVAVLIVHSDMTIVLKLC